MESSSRCGGSLALREGQAGLSGSPHLCPRGLAWGRPCVFPGVAVLSGEPGQDLRGAGPSDNLMRVVASFPEICTDSQT